HRAAATARFGVVAGIAIITVVHHIGSAAVVAAIIWCCECSADHRPGSKSPADPPAPSSPAPAPAATVPTATPSGILDRDRRCVLDRERSAGGSRRGNCIRERRDGTHGPRDENPYRLLNVID